MCQNHIIIITVKYYIIPFHFLNSPLPKGVWNGDVLDVMVEGYSSQPANFEVDCIKVRRV